MLKRKRDSASPSPSLPAKAPPTSRSNSNGINRKANDLSAPTSLLSAHIAQGTSQLKKALTLARGFERQKLGRRIKDASGKGKGGDARTLLKLREEVIVLKGLDLAVVADRQLLKRLGRVKRVRESEAFRREGFAGRELKGSGLEAEANVVARLMGSAPVKECLDGSVESVMDVLGLEKVVITGKGSRGGNQSTKDREVRAEATRVDELTRAEGDEWSGSESEEEDPMDLGDDADGMNDTLPNASNNLQDGGSDIDMDASSDFTGFSARLASSSTDDSESLGSDSYTSEQDLSHRKRTLSTSNIKLLPPIDSEPSSRSESPKAAPTKKKAEVKPPASTAFLPSLMMGGYYSGSGSDAASDIEDEREKPRKNRRGQRARQKIAEAKFGARAKHIAKQSSGRNVGWDAKKGAVEGKVNSKGRMRIPGRSTNSGSSYTKGPTGANGDAVGEKRKTQSGVADGPMHPSWEAARKRKEQGSKIKIDNTAGGGGMGKKITFD